MFVLSTKRDTRIRTYDHNGHTITFQASASLINLRSATCG
jgi:hypothetical protein